MAIAKRLRPQSSDRGSLGAAQYIIPTNVAGRSMILGCLYHSARHFGVRPIDQLRRYENGTKWQRRQAAVIRRDFASLVKKWEA